MHSQKQSKLPTKFSDSVHTIVRSIPKGKVSTYGDIATVAGAPRSARAVGRTAQFGYPDAPWHRVVRSNGKLARRFPGGKQVQASLLHSEGIEVAGEQILNFNDIRWNYGN